VSPVAFFFHGQGRVQKQALFSQDNPEQQGKTSLVFGRLQVYHKRRGIESGRAESARDCSPALDNIVLRVIIANARGCARTRPYLNWIEGRPTKPTVVGSSPARRANGNFPRESSLLFLGDADSMREIIREGCIDLNTEGLIEKRSLYEFDECAALLIGMTRPQ
jgi:hypothetical protein